MRLKDCKTYLPSPISKDQYSALCCVESCGRLELTDQFAVERDGLDTYLMVYVVSGKGYLDYEDEHHTLDAGEGFFINRHEQHGYGADIDDPCTITFVSFSGGSAKYYYDMVIEAKGHLLADGDAHLMASAIDNICETTETLSSRYRVETLSNMLSNLLHGLLTSSMAEEMPYDEVANFVKDSIAQNEAIHVEDMAKQAGYSKYHFTKKFSEYFGMSPYEYIINERIEWTKHQLINTDESMGELAQQCGFVDASHMSNCFKKKVGMTPLAFRKKWRYLIG